jgi:tetratricopeptide (TPR) repeat protein
VKKRLLTLCLLLISFFLFSEEAKTSYFEKIVDNPSITESLKILEDGKEKGELSPTDYLLMYYLNKAQGEREKAILNAIDGLEQSKDFYQSFPLSFIVDTEMTYDKIVEQISFERLKEKADNETDPLLRYNYLRSLYYLYFLKGDKDKLTSTLDECGIPPGFFYRMVDDQLPRINFYKMKFSELDEGKMQYCNRNAFSLSIPSSLVNAKGDSLFFDKIPFNLDRDSNISFRIYSPYPLRMFIDGKEVFLKDVFAKILPPIDLLNVELGAGNHILSVLFYAPTSTAGFNVSFLKDNKSKITFLNEIPAIETRNVLKFSLQTDLFKTGDDLNSRIIRYLDAYAIGDFSEAKVVLDDLLQEHSDSAILNVLNYNLYLDNSTSFPQGYVLSAGEKSVDLLLKNDYTVPELKYFSLYLKSKSSTTDAILSGLKELTENYTKDPRWFVQLVEELKASNFDEEAEEVLLKAEEIFPETSSIVDEVINFYTSKGDYEKVYLLLEKLGKEKNVYSQLENYYSSIGDYSKAIEYLSKEISLQGNFDLYYERNLLNYLIKMEKYEEAMKVADTLVEANPASDNFLSAKGKVLFLMGKSDEAMKIFRSIKERKPSYFGVDYLDWLSGKELPFDKERISFNDAVNNYKDKPEGAPSANILDHQITLVQKDGSSIERYHGIIKIYDKDGVEKEGEQQFPADYLLSLRTIKPDGRVVEPEYVPYKKTIGMSGLEVGDIIEYEYFSLNPPNDLKNDSYYTPYVFLFQDVEKPFYRTSWTIKYPQNFNMQFYEQNLPAPPLEYKEDELKVKKYDYNEMPRVAFEPLSPFKNLYLPLVDAVSGITWNDFFLYLQNQFVGVYPTSKEIDKKAMELTEGIATVETKVERITDFVMGEISGEGERWGDPTETLLMKQGNRFQLTLSLLKSAKIDFDVIFAQSPETKFDKNKLPTQGRYTIPILKIKDAKPFYIYLEESYRDITVLPWFLQGAEAINLSNDNFKPETIPSDLSLWKASLQKEVRKLDTDGNLKVDIEESLDPDQSSQLRSLLKKLEKSRWQEVLQMAFSQQFGNAEIDTYDFVNLEEIKKPLILKASISISSYAAKEGNSLKSQQLFDKFELAKNLSGLKERKLPIEISSPIIMNQEFTLVFPEGKVSAFYTKKKKLNSKFGDYSLEIKEKSNTIIVKRNLYLGNQIIEPKDYNDFTKFLREIDEAENSNFSFELK